MANTVAYSIAVPTRSHTARCVFPALHGNSCWSFNYSLLCCNAHQALKCKINKYLWNNKFNLASDVAYPIVDWILCIGQYHWRLEYWMTLLHKQMWSWCGVRIDVATAPTYSINIQLRVTNLKIPCTLIDKYICKLKLQVSLVCIEPASQNTNL